MFRVNSYQTPYPWLSDSSVTNAWIAEKDYITTSTGVSNWAPHKGTIALTQGTGANQPAFTTNGWSFNQGAISFNGTSQYLAGDSLASLVTGNDMPWSMCISLQLSANTAGQCPAFFSGASTTALYHGIQTFNSSGSKWVSLRKDSTTQVQNTVTSVLPNSGRVVITVIFTGTAITIRINGAATDVAAASCDVTSFALSHFTVGAFNGNGTISNYMGGSIRAIVFGASAWSSSTYAPIENYLLSEINSVNVRPFHQYVSSVPVLYSIQSDLGVTLNSSTVSAWADQSGNGHDFSQATASFQPTYAASGLNGYPTITFDGSNDYMSNSVGSQSSGQVIWEWTVYKLVTWVNGKIFWGGGVAGVWAGPTSSPQIQQVISTGHNTVSAVPVGSWSVAEALFNNSTTDYLKAGGTTATGSSNGAVGAFSSTFLGATNIPSLFSNVALAAHLMTIGQPTVAEKNLLTQAAIAKYGSSVVV